MGLAEQRQLQCLALGLTPNLVPQGGIGGVGQRPQCGVMGAEPLGALCPLCPRDSAHCSFSQTRNATAPAPAEFPPALTWSWECLEMCLKPSVVEGAVSAHISPFSCTQQPSQETFCLLQDCQPGFPGKRGSAHQRGDTTPRVVGQSLETRRREGRRKGGRRRW